MGDHQKRADGWELFFNTYKWPIELIRRDEKFTVSYRSVAPVIRLDWISQPKI